MEERSIKEPPQEKADTLRSPERRVAVELAGVTKRFGEFVAVDDLSLDIYEGEFFSLLGPSGCGKTTTLRMIAGFEEPTEGSISVAGEEVQGVPPYRRPVNTVFQSYAIFPHLNVFDNVAFGLRRSGVKGEELSTRVIKQIPARRMARPEELGPLVVYLASPVSDFMTGETLVIDGGQVAK